MVTVHEGKYIVGVSGVVIIFYNTSFNPRKLEIGERIFTQGKKAAGDAGTFHAGKQILKVKACPNSPNSPNKCVGEGAPDWEWGNIIMDKFQVHGGPARFSMPAVVVSAAPAAAPAAAMPDLPPGWERRWDARSNREYYLNHNAGTTQWDPPRAAAPAPTPAAAPAAAPAPMTAPMTAAPPAPVYYKIKGTDPIKLFRTEEDAISGTHCGEVLPGEVFRSNKNPIRLNITRGTKKYPNVEFLYVERDPPEMVQSGQEEGYISRQKIKEVKSEGGGGKKKKSVKGKKTTKRKPTKRKPTKRKPTKRKPTKRKSKKRKSKKPLRKKSKRKTKSSMSGGRKRKKIRRKY
jgi:hypothetical protein